MAFSSSLPTADRNIWNRSQRDRFLSLRLTGQWRWLPQTLSESKIDRVRGWRWNISFNTDTGASHVPRPTPIYRPSKSELPDTGKRCGGKGLLVPLQSAYLVNSQPR